ncbi:adenylyl-sulfate kinase [Rosistilla carotiformis]|nr:adenylyl-sulfate kinase [Rosistilla carotiformis]
MNEPSSNQRPEVVWHEQSVSRADRERQLAQRGCVIWFTGLSGCGKSTIANALDHKLSQLGAVTSLLDGDNIRHHLCAGPDRLASEHGETFANRFGLGFGAIDREENIRRIGAVAELFASTGIITLTAFVSPYARDRQRVRQLIESVGRPGDFVEVFVDTPLETCEQRDPKGLYKKARAGEIQNFTGISDPYEAPAAPEIHLQTADKSPEALAIEIVQYLKDQGLLIREGGEA